MSDELAARPHSLPTAPCKGSQRAPVPLLLPCHGRAALQSEAQTALFRQPTSQLRGR